MTRCEYAGCPERAVKKLDDWWFCAGHCVTHEHERVGANEPVATPPPPPKPIRCGTIPGWQKHKDEGERPCGKCKDAKGNSDRHKKMRAKRRADIALCGTRSGYMRHIEQNEPTCAACKAAESAYQAERYRSKKACRVKHVVMFSSGAGSWAAARRVADQHGADNLWLIFSDVAMEDGDNYRFLHQAATDVLGDRKDKQLVILRDGRDIWQVFKDNRFLGNSRLANCSKFLKQQPARAWLDANCDPADTTVYVGIDWSETHRLPAVVRNYLPYRAEAPLCSAPYVTRDQVLADLRARGVEPPRLYDLGFSHSNCGGGCVRAGQGQFAHLLKVMPERYAEWERNEQDLREHLDADVAILRDRSGGTAVPLTLRTFRERQESGWDQADLFDIGGCGCFVDEGDAA